MCLHLCVTRAALPLSLSHHLHPPPNPRTRAQCKEGDAAEGYEAIVAWAAAGVIANLAMEPDVPKKLVQAGAMEGLLGLMASPDWLESLQVTATRRERGGAEATPPMILSGTQNAWQMTSGHENCSEDQSRM